MKKLILSIALILVAMSNINAQEFAFGARVIPFISWSHVENNDPQVNFNKNGVKLGIAIGPAAKYKFNDNFDLEGGILFSWQGSKFTQDSTAATGIDSDFNVKRQYMHISVNANGNVPLNDLIDVSMSFGVMPAIQISSHYDIKNSVVNLKNQKVPSIPFNLYLVAGAGVQFHLTDIVTCSANVRYNHGTADVWRDNKDNYVPKLKEKNHFVSLDLGVFINF